MRDQCPYFHQDEVFFLEDSSSSDEVIELEQDESSDSFIVDNTPAVSESSYRTSDYESDLVNENVPPSTQVR